MYDGCQITTNLKTNNHKLFENEQQPATAHECKLKKHSIRFQVDGGKT